MPVPYSLLPTPYSLFPVSCSLFPFIKFYVTSFKDLNHELIACLDAVAHGGNPQDRAASLSSMTFPQGVLNQLHLWELLEELRPIG
ncbi:MAG: hypothetical protein F6J90_08065 [Moorea sp. SIOASIH]|nr:hypothetical protein [Moorena sp. SIOASIH]